VCEINVYVGAGATNSCSPGRANEPCYEATAKARSQPPSTAPTPVSAVYPSQFGAPRPGFLISVLPGRRVVSPSLAAVWRHELQVSRPFLRADRILPPARYFEELHTCPSPAYSTPIVAQFSNADDVKLSDLGASSLPRSSPTPPLSVALHFPSPRQRAPSSVPIPQHSTSYHRQTVFPNPPSSHRLLRRELETPPSERSVQSHERAENWAAEAVE
jgi:hypothetical protein